MFFTLLFVTFAIAIVVTFIVVKMFDKSIASILKRIVQDEISEIWKKYIVFASYVVGISGGVRIYQLERYISAPDKEVEILTLTTDRWVLEVYRTVIETLQSLAWMYLVVFIFALIAYVIVRSAELRYDKKDLSDDSKKTVDTE